MNYHCVRRATAFVLPNFSIIRISIHALQAESDQFFRALINAVCNFNPRPPSGERPQLFSSTRSDHIYFNPRPPSGERPLAFPTQSALPNYFNPRPPSGERQEADHAKAELENFNPRPPSGERLVQEIQNDLHLSISIHALQAESDAPLICEIAFPNNFNPRPPSGERHSRSNNNRQVLVISIHALQAESDIKTIPLILSQQNFNPRPPSGERLDDEASNCITGGHFNPRPPSGERRIGLTDKQREDFISIHALQAESDLASYTLEVCFNEFQSTPSKRRATTTVDPNAIRDINFNPRPPSGERRHTAGTTMTPTDFNPRPPSGERRPSLILE